MIRLVVGVVGTRSEITYCQKKTFKKLLKSLRTNTIHHRDYVGAEEWAHGIATSMKIKTVIYPPDKPEHRAFCEGDIIFPPDKPDMCGRKIVFNVDALIVIPKSTRGEPMTVLWNTVRFAAQSRLPIYIINPEGEIEK